MSFGSSIRRMPAWLVVLWVGVIGSVLAWGWAWVVGRGPSVVPFVWSIGAIVFAGRAAFGSRWALLFLALFGALALFVGVLYVGLAVTLTLGQQPVLDWLPVAALPPITALILVIGSVWGLRATPSA
jgi:hypothetical protein